MSDNFERSRDIARGILTDIEGTIETYRQAIRTQEKFRDKLLSTPEFQLWLDLPFSQEKT